MGRAMKQDREPHSGSLEAPTEHLFAGFAIPTHQIAATVHPENPTSKLARSSRRSDRRMRAMINDLLSDPSVR